MRTRRERLDSLAHWPKKDIYKTIERFPEAGFYYELNPLQPDSDALRCIYCDLRLMGWTAGDDPFIQHAIHSPDCIHLQAVKGTEWIELYVPVIEAVQQNVGGSNARMIGQPLCPETYRRSQSLNIRQAVGQYVTPGGKPFVQPLYPEYREYRERRRTLRGRHRRRSALAEAGFFGTGISDMVTCYYCGMKMPDNGEDPFERHANLNENCFHVILVKGEGYLNHVRSPRMDREAMQEEALETIAGGGAQVSRAEGMFRCDVCRRQREKEGVVCCIRCHSIVCLDRDCLYPACCPY